ERGGGLNGLPVQPVGLNCVPRAFQLCGGDKAYLSPSKIRERHQVYLEAAIEKFRAIKKMGSQALIMQSEDRLTRDINEMLISYLKFNQSKNLFSIVRTPSAMLLLIISIHVLSGFLGLLGFGFLSVIFNFVIGLCSLTLLTWSYVKYTGQSPLLGEIIDSLSEKILSGVSRRCSSTPVPSRGLQGGPWDSPATGQSPNRCGRRQLRLDGKGDVGNKLDQSSRVGLARGGPGWG
ncbi:hypothetical protein chiPu_0026385, partial [Chiloscyllium punctatum]|nr:hypothetical protein [Chiloscyllium punctatum]